MLRSRSVSTVVRIVLFGLLAVCCFCPVLSANADDDEQKPMNMPSYYDPATGIYYDETGRPMDDPMISGQLTRSVRSTGGDRFGYTWTDQVQPNWIDVSQGIPLSFQNLYSAACPISIGFDFKFYEKTYNQIFISALGFVTFQQSYSSYFYNIPNPQSPNNLISVFRCDLTSINGYVRYLSGGTAPNRWFAVEWNNILLYGGNTVTFELVLRENGDIEMNYGNFVISGYKNCVYIGMEDSIGADGFQISSCPWPPANSAVKITRPAPAARVGLFPIHYGTFCESGKPASVQLEVRNTGELGSDTYNVAVSSNWSTALSDGMTPLSDTNSDGKPDTGTVVQGGTAVINVSVTTPASAQTGAWNDAAVTLTSAKDASKTVTVHIRTAVPARFAQVYSSAGKASLSLASPVSGLTAAVTPELYNPGVPVMAKLSNDSYISLWTKYYWDSAKSIYIDDIEYIHLDRWGNSIIPIKKLTDNQTGAQYRTYIRNIGTAAAPDGKTGVIWYQYSYDSAGKTNYNVYFAVIDSSGNVTTPPVNLTGNTLWGGWSEVGVPRFDYPKIAAAPDNRFILAWTKDVYTETSTRLSQIYTGIRGTNGAEIRAAAQLAVTNPDNLESPCVTGLTGNRFLLVWFNDTARHLYYSVTDSSGAAVKPETQLTSDTGYYDYLGAVQLSNGSILTAWTGGGSIQYAVLNSSYAVAAGPSALNNPSRLDYESAPSVTADGEGNGILTWRDNVRFHLYYALVSGTGAVLTEPMIFRTGTPLGTTFDIDYNGYGNAPFPVSTMSAVFGKIFTNIAGHQGLPVVNAAVSLQGTQFTAQTQSDGSFALSNVPAAGYTLVISSPYLNNVNQPIQLTSGDLLKPADIYMTPSSVCGMLGDVNGDNLISLEEAIHALQVVSGVK